jgi:hypothetical protein
MRFAPAASRSIRENIPTANTPIMPGIDARAEFNQPILCYCGKSKLLRNQAGKDA